LGQAKNWRPLFCVSWVTIRSQYNTWYFYSLVCFPLEEVALLRLVFGTGEELASVVLCELGDLSKDGGTAVAAPRVVQIGPAKMLARLRPEQSKTFFSNLCLTEQTKISQQYQKYYQHILLHAETIL
jgi:hypothetical protein